MCCTPTQPCRRCALWDELAAAVPVGELRPCTLCEEPWPPAALDPRTRLCPACREEILERQTAEASTPEPARDLEACRQRAEERRRALLEEAQRRLREMPPVMWDVDDPFALAT